MRCGPSPAVRICGSLCAAVSTAPDGLSLAAFWRCCPSAPCAWLPTLRLELESEFPSQPRSMRGWRSSCCVQDRYRILQPLAGGDSLPGWQDRVRGSCNRVPPRFCQVFGRSRSDAGVPSIASFCTRAPQTLAEGFQIVSDGQVGKEFHVLVADLAWEPQAKRPAVANW